MVNVNDSLAGYFKNNTPAAPSPSLNGPLAGTSTPKYADIFRYISMPGVYDNTGNKSIDDKAGLTAPTWQTNGHWETRQVGGGENGTRDEQFWVPGEHGYTEGTPDQYKGLQKWNETGDERSGWQLDADALNKLNLPKTKFGTVDNVAFFGTGKEPTKNAQGAYNQILYDSVKPVWDNNYGWIAPKKELHGGDEKQDAMINAGIMTALSLGMGPMGLGVMPSWASGAVGLAKTIGEGGNWKNAAINLAPSLIGGFGGNLGLPPEMLQYLQYGKTAASLANYFKGR